MGLFDRQFDQIKAYISLNQNKKRITEFNRQELNDWPEAKNRNLVLNSDMAFELGNPKSESISFLFWVDDYHKVDNGKIRLVGPDFTQIGEKQISFGKVVILGGNGFCAENSYERFREMENVRYDVALKGYMMRAVPQINREWSRVSTEAVNNGFSFSILGSELLSSYLKLDYIETAEILFITSNRPDVEAIRPMADSTFEIISAMNKLTEELNHDCDECDYSAVCDDIEELRSMRKSIKKKEIKRDA